MRFTFWHARLFSAIFQIIQSIRMGMWLRRSISPSAAHPFMPYARASSPSWRTTVELWKLLLLLPSQRLQCFSLYRQLFDGRFVGRFTPRQPPRIGCAESGWSVPILPPCMGSLVALAFCHWRGGGGNTHLLVPNKRNLKQTVKLKSTVLKWSVLKSWDYKINCTFYHTICELATPTSIVCTWAEWTQL